MIRDLLITGSMNWATVKKSVFLWWGIQFPASFLNLGTTTEYWVVFWGVNLIFGWVAMNWLKNRYGLTIAIAVQVGVLAYLVGFTFVPVSQLRLYNLPFQILMLPLNWVTAVMGN